MPHEHEGLQYALRAVLYLGVFLLLGTGILVRYLGWEVARSQRWRVWRMLSVGFLLAVGASLYSAYHTVWMLGDVGLLGSYLLQTQQGNLVLLRLLVLPLLLLLSMGWFRWDRWVYPPLAMGLLLTLSLTAHAAGRGVVEVLADLLHLALGVAWGGGLLALAALWPGAPSEANLRALRRIDRAGVGLFLGTVLLGGYLAAVRLGNLDGLWTTAYGQRLLVKLVLVLLILLLAATNRFWLLPLRGAVGRRGAYLVGLEAVFLLGVLGATGVLASTEPPGSPQAPRLVRIAEAYGEHRFVGQLFSQGGVVHLYLDLRDGEGNLLSAGPALRVGLRREGSLYEEVLRPYHRSQYHLAYLAEGSGAWEVWLELPHKRLEYVLWVGR